MATPSDSAAVVSKAVVRAAHDLGLAPDDLAKVLGIPASVARFLIQATCQLEPGEKPYELALVLLCLHRSLGEITGGEPDAVQAWMRAPNSALNGVPLDLIQTVPGLMNVIAYLESRRTII